MVCPVKDSLLAPSDLRVICDLFVKGYEIEGLRTPYVIWRESYLDQLNRTMVKVNYQVPEGLDVDLSMYRTCFPVVGGMSIGNFFELVTNELHNTGFRPVTFIAEGKVLAEDCLFSYINKAYMCKDGFLSLACMIESIEEEAEEEAVDDLY